MTFPLRLKTVTFGCKVNQYESQRLREGLQRIGYEEVRDGQTPDLIVVNSCAVTAESEAKCRKRIRLLAKRHPRAEILVTGCYAVRKPAEVARLPGVTAVAAGPGQVAALLARRGLDELPEGISAFDGRHRAWIKVQDGCRQGCSYCIVPRVRPVLCSRPVEEILAEVRRLVRGGYPEIVLCGIRLGLYGAERPEPAVDLAALVRRMIDLEGAFRVRLSSIEAPEITDPLLDIMAERPDRLCPHLHVPLQSGSDEVRQAMRRRFSVRQFLDCCQKIHRRLDRPALTTDVMVGFPSETEADFHATCRAVEGAGFSRVHAFRFSPRPGTPAANLPRPIPQRIHRQWADRLGQLSNALHLRYLKSLKGETLQVLIESADGDPPGFVRGTAERYVTVALPGTKLLEGRLMDVKTETIEGDRLRGFLARDLGLGIRD
ncbi:MAG: tRNA (N(6)-L-threonylcarbamoyladenosine(37)-C(2))-methylthiotransferase MtaB [Pirellulales bacterium]|nr:tRNA (N(6)-L-threonylcarbamoyladenosine(37)-C(2))-methylthiotransferase MtaB [Pirellulales bacterium]